MTRFAFKLEAMNQLTNIRSVAEVSEWSMDGNDPYFVLRKLPRKLRPGIYELLIDFPNGWDHLIEPTIYFDGGRGFTALDRVTVFFQAAPDKGRTTARAYFRLKSSARQLRFDPSTSAGLLSIGNGSLRRIPKLIWRANAFFDYHRKRIQSISALKRSLGNAMRIFRQGGFRGLNRAFKEVAEREASGSFYELPFEDFVERCRNDAAKIRLKQNWTIESFNSRQSEVTVVVPVHRVKPKWLDQLLLSLAAQTINAFDLILVFDGAQTELVKATRRFTDKFHHLDILELPQRVGVSSACNTAIQHASTKYIVIVDHDDILPEYLIEFFYRTLENAPSDIIYFDEALIDEEATREISLTTRTAFDLRHYLSHPYIVHPIFVKRDLLNRVEGFDSTLKVSQDVDLFLRCVKHARTITHVPAVGYFWRSHKHSLGHTAAAEVSRNTRAAISRFVNCYYGWDDFVVEDGKTFNTYEVSPPLPRSSRVAIIIPTKNGHDLLRRCLDSLSERTSTNSIPFEVFVIDHESDELNTLALLRNEERAGRARVLAYQGPWNFSAINNYAVRQIEALDNSFTHYCFMNNDIVVRTKDWLDRLIARFSYPDVGIVGARLLYPDGGIQHGGVVVGLCGVAEHAFKFAYANSNVDQHMPGYLGSLTATRDFRAVTAALMIISRSVFSSLKGFDEDLKVAFNDTDLCLRAEKLGFKSCYVGSVVALHLESATRGAASHNDDTSRFCRRYSEIIQDGDPHYGRYMDWSSPELRFTLSYPKPFRLQTTTISAPVHPARADTIVKKCNTDGSL